jgi:hypothetical protein
MANELSARHDSDSGIYTAYLTDLGRIGGRHENSRKFYISVMSALFVFLSLAGKDAVFFKVQDQVLRIVALVGVLICLAWFEHMRSFGKLYLAKLSTLRALEEDLKEHRPLQPFQIETDLLLHPKKKKLRFRYTPLTLVDRIIPLASALLFLSLLQFKLS